MALSDPFKVKRKAKRGSQRSRGAVSRLRAICMALPEAHERLSHGEPTWFAGKGKVFAMLDDHHHGAPHLSVWLPAALGAQEALVESEPGVRTTFRFRLPSALPDHERSDSLHRG